MVHARNADRAATLEPLVDRGADLIVADFTDRDAVRRVAAELNDRPPLDAVIHNVGRLERTRGHAGEHRRALPADGAASPSAPADLPQQRLPLRRPPVPRRSRLVRVIAAAPTPTASCSSRRFAAAVARLHPEVLSNAVDPGWVPTRMGGAGAPDDLELGHRTQEWLAVSNEPEATTTGGYWYHRKRQQPHRAVTEKTFQDRLLQTLAAETGAALPLRP